MVVASVSNFTLFVIAIEDQAQSCPRCHHEILKAFVQEASVHSEGPINDGDPQAVHEYIHQLEQRIEKLEDENGRLKSMLEEDNVSSSICMPWLPSRKNSDAWFTVRQLLIGFG